MIADITGYTVYLRDSELAHAQQTLGALLELLVTRTRPPLVLSKIEGDAVFSYALDGTVPRGQSFLEMIETTYVEFRTALEQMAVNTTCSCNACANIAGLDLKFVVHVGDFVVMAIAGNAELQGADVTLVHRILKNTVTPTTGWRAYVLYTESAVAELGLEDLTGSMSEHVERYDDIGTVRGWVQDLAPAIAAHRALDRGAADPATSILEVSTEIPLPCEVVWGYLIDPEHRRVLIGSDRQEVRKSHNGRIVEGSVYECYHGDRVIPQLVIGWFPPERMITRDLLPLPGGSTFLNGYYRLSPTGAGTRVTQTMAEPSGPWYGRLLTRLVIPRMQRQFQRDIDGFRDHVVADYQRAAPPSV